MASRRKPEPGKKRAQRRAMTPEGRENQLIAAAVDLAEKQINDGSASAQVISHYLKMGSTREKLEQERLANENRLTEAKVEQMESLQRVEGLYAEALEAFRGYRGEDPDELEMGYED